VLAGFHRAHDLTQAILELADTHRLHRANVAPCGYFVNERMGTGNLGSALK
jgi:hypothetical protein